MVARPCVGTGTIRRSGTIPQNSSARSTETTAATTRPTALSYARSSRCSTPNSWSTGANGWELELLLGDVDLAERCTTRIGGSRGLTQVQAGAGADHRRHRSELDRDLGGVMAVILGVDVARNIDFINQAEGTAEAVTATRGTLPPISTPASRATQRDIRYFIAAAAAAATILCIFPSSCSVFIC